MEKFTIYTGTTVPLMNDNIDTDQILPKQFLKLIDKKGFGKYLMYSWRYKDNKYTEDPDFVFNRPEYRKATILITGDNFGAGSSREHLEQQKIISPVGEFTFEIDGEWKHKLLNGLDDIGITMQYEDLITEYEKHRPSYWQ